MNRPFVQVGRLCTGLLKEERDKVYVIVGIQDDKMVIIQDGSERRRVSVNSLHLLDEVVSPDDYARIEAREDHQDNDFERFVRKLRKEVEMDLLRKKGVVSPECQ